MIRRGFPIFFKKQQHSFMDTGMVEDRCLCACNSTQQEQNASKYHLMNHKQQLDYFTSGLNGSDPFAFHRSAFFGS